MNARTRRREEKRDAFPYCIPLRLGIFAFVSLLSISAAAQQKKIISYGQDWPNTAYCREHVSEMEKYPYDGIVIAISPEHEPKYSGDSVGFRIWGKQKFELKDYAYAIDDLKNTKFKKFTDNFVQVEAMPGDADWFSDEDFAKVAANFKMLAKIAHDGGCKGLEFDPEEYGQHKVWSWVGWPETEKQKHSEDEAVAVARQRGREIMRAINSEFPNVTIVSLFGPSFTTGRLASNDHRYRLLAPFFEGMCEVATNGTTIVDGYEQSYGFRTPVSFEDAREIQKKARDYFSDKNAFDRVMRVGFGLWMDNNSGVLGWHTDDFALNHFQPGTWQTAVYLALKNSDEYVWTWHEKFNLWSGKNVSEPYMTAQEKGRTAPGRIATTEVSRNVKATRAVEIQGHDDASTFGDLLKSQNVPLDLAQSKWLFHLDVENKGASEQWWQSPGKASGDWKPIKIGQYWEEQGYDYDGIAWYHTTFDLPNVQREKHITLSIGAADESAWVYLNGKQIAAHDLGEGGWDQRIDIDITNALKSSGNDLYIRVLDRIGPGGLWKGVKIFETKK